jgi:hypothetical protein
VKVHAIFSEGKLPTHFCKQMMNHESQFLTRKPLHSSHMGVLNRLTQAAELCFACPKFLQI